MAKNDKNNLKKIGLSALPIGIVSALIGYVAIKGQDGIERLLKLGDKLFSGDEISTGDDGHTVIDLIDGSKVELDEQSSLVLDDDVIDAKTLEQIQQAILDGITPAAGDVMSEGGSETAQVNIDELSSEPAGIPVGGESGTQPEVTARAEAGDRITTEQSGAMDITPPENPLGKLPTLSIADVTVVEPPPAGAGGQGGQGGQGGHETDTDSSHDTGHDTGTDSHDSGSDSHASGSDSHDSGSDSHDSGSDSHDSGSDSHDSGSDSHDSGSDSHDSGHDTGTDSHDSGHDTGHDEGHNTGPVYAIFTITLSHPALTDVRVDFSTANGTAITGGRGVNEGDYGQTSGTLVIRAGETTGTVEVEILGDRGVESDNEYFYLNLSNAQGASIADGQAIATIIDSGHGEGSTGAGDTLVGTPGDDVLTGSGGRDNISGEAGDDILSGRGGPDTLDGGEGDDVLYGLGGPDTMSGGPGNDQLVGHGGPDVMDGGTGDDFLSGGGAPDTMYGGEGNDDMHGGGGPDQMDGGPGNDILLGEGGPDTMHGGEGHDEIYGGGGPDTIYGDEGHDAIYGGGGPDVIDGGAGDDILVGGGAGDVFHFEGFEGNDTIIDFKPQQGDAIDISSILDGYDEADPISNYVQLSATDEPDTYELLVNPSGSAMDDFQVLVTLENLEHVTTVDDLLDNGNLIVTTIT